MARLLVLYHPPADPTAFDAYYFGVHVPIAKKVPGVRSFSASAAPPRALTGAAPHLIAQLDFDTMRDLEAALASPEGQATAADLANFAHAGATLLVYETRGLAG